MLNKKRGLKSLTIAATIFLLVFLVALIVQNTAYAEPKTVEEKNKEFIKAYTEDFWNTHNIDAFDTYYTDDYVVHMANGDMNREEYKGLCQAYFAAFPDLNIITDDLVAEGNKITKVWTVHCTHKGEFMGIPATDKKVVVKGIEVFRLENDKIAELWASMDNLGMMQQLGAIPPMGE